MGCQAYDTGSNRVHPSGRVKMLGMSVGVMGGRAKSDVQVGMTILVLI